MVNLRLRLSEQASSAMIHLSHFHASASSTHAVRALLHQSAIDQEQVLVIPRASSGLQVQKAYVENSQILAARFSQGAQLIGEIEC